MGVLNVHELPPPQSGTIAEVQFRRLLLKCAERTLTLEGWKKDPKFHLYVESLQEQLSVLSSNAGAGLSDDILSRYKDNVDHLSNELLTPDIPPYCKTIIPVDRQSKPPASGQPVIPKGQGISQRKHGGAPSAIANSSLDDSVKRELEAQSNIQESLTNDLVNMASQLKDQAKAVERAVGERNEILDQTDTVLSENAASAINAQQRAGQQYKRSKVGTCMMLMVLLGVGCVFTWMLFFIKFTSIAGYRGQRGEPKPVDAPHDEL